MMAIRKYKLSDLSSGAMYCNRTIKKVDYIHANAGTVIMTEDGRKFISGGTFTESSKLQVGQTYFASYASTNQGVHLVEVQGVVIGTDGRFIDNVQSAFEVFNKEERNPRKGGSELRLKVTDLENNETHDYFYYFYDAFCRGSGAEILSFTPVSAA